VRQPGRVADLVQQDDRRRHTRHWAAVHEDHRRDSGPTGQAGTAGERCRGPHRAADDHDERRPILPCGGDDLTPPRRDCTWSGRLTRLDQHAREVGPRDHDGVDPPMGDALVSEACQGLAEHGSIERFRPGETPRAAVGDGWPGRPGRIAGPAGYGLLGNGRDEHDGCRLDRGRSSPTGIGHDRDERHDRRGERRERHPEADGDPAPSDDGPPGPAGPAPARPRRHRLTSACAATSSVATASNR
jgi:hypothetical protein